MTLAKKLPANYFNQKSKGQSLKNIKLNRHFKQFKVSIQLNIFLHWKAENFRESKDKHLGAGVAQLPQRCSFSFILENQIH